MNTTRALAASLSLAALTSGCATAPTVVDADPVRREALLGAVTALEGRWAGEVAGLPEEEGPQPYTEFALTAQGTGVREIMGVGEPHEMTNMYALDGNTLVMTHYCSAGNQPRMRASSITDDGRIEFLVDSVADLKSADEAYMGSMTLVILDANHIEQHWQSLKGGVVEDHLVIDLTRVP